MPETRDFVHEKPHISSKGTPRPDGPSGGARRYDCLAGLRGAQQPQQAIPPPVRALGRAPQSGRRVLCAARCRVRCPPALHAARDSPAMAGLRFRHSRLPPRHRIPHRPTAWQGGIPHPVAAHHQPLARRHLGPRGVATASAGCQRCNAPRQRPGWPGVHQHGTGSLPALSRAGRLPGQATLENDTAVRHLAGHQGNGGVVPAGTHRPGAETARTRMARAHPARADPRHDHPCAGRPAPP